MSQIQRTSSAADAVQWQYHQSLQQTNADPVLRSNAGDPTAFALDPAPAPSAQATGGSAPPFSLGAMSALIAAQEQSASTGLSPQQQDVFGKLDADGDGKVTSAELQSAFGSNNTDVANYVMGKLDTDGDGAISQSEFAAGTTRGAGHHHHHMHVGPPPDGSQGGQAAQGAQDPLSALLSSSADGASAQTTNNSDGSTTTTISYADGSKVSMTSAANASSAQGGDASGSTSTSQQTQQNLLQQLIKLQAQLTQNFQTSMPVATI
jgi:hypothetical protein